MILHTGHTNTMQESQKQASAISKQKCKKLSLNSVNNLITG